jgi:hypothetical protein
MHKVLIAVVVAVGLFAASLVTATAAVPVYQPVTVDLVNVTAPADDPDLGLAHVGDVIRADFANMPNGKNYHTASCYPGPYYAERFESSGNASVTFTVPTFQPVPGDPSVGCVLYSDNDRDLTNDRLQAITGFVLLPPR